MITKSGVRRGGATRKAQQPCQVIAGLLRELKQYAAVSKRSFQHNERLLVEIRGVIMGDARRVELCKAM